MIGTLQLLAACERTSSLRSVIVRGSAAIYGCEGPSPAFFTEDLARELPLRTRFQRDISELEEYFENFARRHPELTCTMLRYQPEVGAGLDSPLVRYLTLPVVPVQLGYDPRLQFVHADDATAALEAAVHAPVRGAVNVGPRGSISLSRALRILRRPAVAIPAPLFEPAIRRVGARLGAGGLLGDGVRMLRFGRGVDITAAAASSSGSSRSYDAAGAIEDLARRASGTRIGPSLHPGALAGRLTGAGPMSEQTGVETISPEAIAEFLGALRGGVESGLDPLAAAQRAAGSLPAQLRESLETVARRLRGEYHEDEWGFDEQFAEAVFPLFDFLYRVLVAGRGGGSAQRAGSRPGADRRQPRRVAVPVRRDDDDDGDHEGASAAALAPVHGPRLGVRAPVRVGVHAPGGRRSGATGERSPAAGGR